MQWTGRAWTVSLPGIETSRARASLILSSTSISGIILELPHRHEKKYTHAVASHTKPGEPFCSACPSKLYVADYISGVPLG